MLTEEQIKATQGLDGLTPEQVTTIANLSKADEQSVISAKYREMHDAIDAQIKDATGIEKGTAKTTDYLATALKEFGSFKKKSTDLETENNTLKEQIKAGSADKELLAQKEATIADLTKKFNDKNEELKTAKEQFEKSKLDMRIDADIMASMTGITFKEGLNDAALDVLKKQAVTQIKGNNPSYINVNGNDTLVYHDANGVEMRNPDNQLNFFTTAEMLRGVFKNMGILGEAQQGGGAGGGQHTNTATSLAGATTKAEAYNAARSMAKAKGLTEGSVAFENEIAAIWSANKDVIAKLKD